MPRTPHFAASVSSMRGSVFTALAHRLSTFDGEVYPFHVGDTWMEPAAGCRMEDLTVADHPGLHRYEQPQGRSSLVRRIAERFEERTGLATEPEQILVTAGATGALGAAAGALLEPNEEVLILAPHWPLIEGIVRSARAQPVPVPFYGEVRTAEEAVAAVESRVTPATTALYLSTPNNPTGHTIPEESLRALVDWARTQDLWIWSDEVYEDYAYRTAHAYARPMAPERTFSVHSFSKAYGMAGNRCGYAIGPREAMAQVRKISTHTFYSTPTASQIAAERVLGGEGDRWVERARTLYRDLGERCASILGLDPPEGSTFLFLDVAEHLDGDGLAGFLERCVDRGLFAAPGPSFGPYPTHLRVCYTATPPEVTERGIRVLAELLGRQADDKLAGS